MKSKLPLLVMVLVLILPLVLPIATEAASLGDLPFGSVIKIQPTDTEMCNAANCTTKTNFVLPFKLVKMQARRTDISATALGDVNGYAINDQSYTYWMLLDNYCWWGKSDCRYYDGTRHSNYASWNASGNTSDTYSNNITDTKSNNILKVLANFYDSLPADIGGVAKEEAVPVFAWDMYGVSIATPPAVGWSGGTWTNTIYDPNTNVNSRFTFTGSNTATNPPIMNSRIGLVSFHEWQGGNVVSTSNPTSNNGSGGSYCLARFGTANCAASSGNMFDDTNTSAGNQNTVASATNPRPRYPWTRSPFSSNSTYVWYLNGSTSYSLYFNYAGNNYGVSPTLWLSSTIDTVCGEGNYTFPYQLTGDPCNNVPAITLTSPANQNFVLVANSFQQPSPGTSKFPSGTVFNDQIVFRGTAEDLDQGDDLTVSLLLKSPTNHQNLFTKKTTLVANGNAQEWAISVSFSELSEAIQNSGGALSSPISGFEFIVSDGKDSASNSAFFLGEVALNTRATLSKPTMTTDLDPANCPLNGNNFDLCVGGLASFSALLTDPDPGQNLTLAITITNPTSGQTLTKSLAAANSSPLSNAPSGIITFNFAELLALGENLTVAYLLDDTVTVSVYDGGNLVLYPAANVITNLSHEIYTRFSSTIYEKSEQHLISQGFLKLKDLADNYQVWAKPLWLYHEATNSAEVNPYPHPFLVKMVSTNPQLGVLKLKGK